MSSSPTELHYSPGAFLARWMPSSARAGVILTPSLGLEEPARHATATGSAAPLHPDDSFSSDFAPLPASVDSSCIGAGGPLDASYPGSHGLDDVSAPPDLPLTMKLEQLRKWQQHIHEQLKAHQLEELLCLQAEQQRLLGAANGSQICTESSESVGSRDEFPAQQGPEINLEAMGKIQPPATGTGGTTHQQPEHHEEEGWTSRGEEQPDASPEQTLTEAEDAATQDQVSHDRPIKPGVGGQKQTFEELLEEKLRLEEQRLKSSKQKPDRRDAVQVPRKRPFLRRGQGLSRFTNKALVPRADTMKDAKLQRLPKCISRSNSAPSSLQTGSQSSVQRRTAVLNKENRIGGPSLLPRPKGRGSRAAPPKALCSSQKQNAGPKVLCAIGGRPQDSKVANQDSSGGPRAAPEAAEAQPHELEIGRSEENGEATWEASFQEKLRHWECDRHMESVALGEFELLEQAAEELSFSSNSSFVLKVLQMDQQRREAALGLHQRRLSSTPIKSAGGEAQTSHTSQPAGDGGKEDKRQDEAATYFPATPKAPYDKRPYEDEDRLRDCEEEDVPRDENDSTLTEDAHGQQEEFVFDDHDTWTDLDETTVCTESDCRTLGSASSSEGEEPPPPGRTVTRKVSAGKPVEPDKDPDPPPASQLMIRLFPSLKSHNSPVRALPADSKRPTAEPAQQVQSSQLRERLAELEIEIERFKKEKAALTKLVQENERRQEELRRERQEFERSRAEQLARFEEYKKEESRKLAKERKLLEQHASAARAIPDKKERQEIQALKQQLSALQEELKRRESRWSSTHSRLRQQVDALTQEKASLQDEVRVLEKLRLSSLKRSCGAQRDHEGPRAAESAARGVTFALPADCSPPHSSAPAAARRNSKDCSQAAAGRKSSLRKTGGSSSVLPPRNLEDTVGVARKRWNITADPPGSLQGEGPEPAQEEGPEPEQEEEPEPEQEEEPESAQEIISHPDGKIEKVLSGGARLIIFPNGTRKTISADGRSAKVSFFNGDTKEMTADQRVIYFYAEAQTTHITFPDGTELLHFPNKQTEKHFPDGRKEITFPDQTVKKVFPDGREESKLTDGTLIHVQPDGTKEIHFITGQKEVHTAHFKRRHYPDGTVKMVFSDGRQETRYPTGRLRVKDRDGKVILDQLTSQTESRTGTSSWTS